MPTLSWETERRGDVTRIELRVHNDTTEHRRIRVVCRHDGPDGGPDPEAGVPMDGTSCLLAPGERCALEYAIPESPADPPAAIVGSTVLRAGEATTAGGQARTDGGGVGAGPRSSVRGHLEADDTPGPAQTALPPAVAAWLGAIERRVRAVESDGQRSGTVGHATVVADTETLASLERRASRLGDRLAAGVDRCGSSERADR